METDTAEESCINSDSIECRQGFAEVMDFIMPAMCFFIPFVAGMIQARFWVPLGVWAACACLFFLFFQQLLICRHCPRYASDDKTLRCHAAYGLPKIPAYSPRPLNRLEKSALILWSVFLFCYYIPFFIIAKQWALLLITSWALATEVRYIHRHLCIKCVNTNCPFNRLDTAAD